MREKLVARVWELGIVEIRTRGETGRRSRRGAEHMRWHSWVMCARVCGFLNIAVGFLWDLGIQRLSRCDLRHKVYIVHVDVPFPLTCEKHNGIEFKFGKGFTMRMSNKKLEKHDSLEQRGILKRRGHNRKQADMESSRKS